MFTRAIGPFPVRTRTTRGIAPLTPPILHSMHITSFVKNGYICIQREVDQQQKVEEACACDDRTHEEEDHARELQEWRQLREEQDRAYAESLLVDQQKCAEAAQREEVYLTSVCIR